MRLLMTPGPDANLSASPGGIATVIAKYLQHMPDHGIEFVTRGQAYDVEMVHAGVKPFESPRGANVAALHGLYWTAEIPMAYEYHQVNARLADSIRHATIVTAPSEWVAETVRRDTHRRPYIVPHGVDIDEWRGGEDGGYVLWAKNIEAHVCDPAFVVAAANLMPDTMFISTYGMAGSNLRVFGRPLAGNEMKDAMLGCGIYLATAPETFGIATLEAMAAGKPVVGFDVGFQPVVHGVTGYLAAPGDVDDLVKGIRWARENYATLSRNGRMLAALYSWDRACEKMIDALVDAEIKSGERGVSIVIPCRNKGQYLEAAVQSALAQDTLEPIQVVIVDDCSTDNSREIGENLARHRRVRLIEHDRRQGVAGARNTGIDAARYEMIVTLDADDQIAPTFVRECLLAMRRDNALGVAYTGLGVTDGERVRRSEWPGAFDYEQQAAGHNQVPTCSLFRKDVWRSVGGYRPRYTRYDLLGYGSEDAAFWLRAADLGWGIKQVTTEPLFIYREGGGTSSNYNEIKWNDFYSTERGRLFCSPPHPGDSANLGRVYDPPRVSVIIPVGEGHEILAADAIDSVEAQTYYRHETIVVWDSSCDIPAWYKSGYPFVRWIRRVKGERYGAGAARNAGAAAARTEMLLFLDADDLLSKMFLERAVSEWNARRAIVYSDYVGVQYLPDNTRAEDVAGAVAYDPLTNQVTVQARLNDFDAERAKAQPTDPPYVWCPVTCLVPKAWHDSIGGFRADLPSWEDWDYHIRMAKAGRPYHRIDEYLWTYRLHAGQRREEARTRFLEWGLFERVGK